jgi:hypothetical protein
MRSVHVLLGQILIEADRPSRPVCRTFLQHGEATELIDEGVA